MPTSSTATGRRSEGWCYRSQAFGDVVVLEELAHVGFSFNVSYRSVTPVDKAVHALHTEGFLQEILLSVVVPAAIYC